MIFVVANFLQILWRKTLKNVGFLAKTGTHSFKTKKKMEKKGKNTDLNTLLYPPMMYLVTQFVFWVVSYFKFCKKCVNGKVRKLYLLWYKKCKNSPLALFPICLVQCYISVEFSPKLLNFILFPERNLDKCVGFSFKV